MPALDIFHECVKQALIKEGWTVTDEPLSLKVGKKDLFIDLAAEKLLIAEKEKSKIAVEVKSFVGTSEIEDLKNAIGQYILYEKVLKRQFPERKLYLAIRDSVFKRLFTEEEIGKILLEEQILKLIIFDHEKEVITQWIN